MAKSDKKLAASGSTKAPKAAKTKKGKKPKSDKPGVLANIKMAYKISKANDKRLGLFVLLGFVAGFLAGFGVFSLLPPGWLILDLILAIPFGLMTAVIVLSRRATKAQIAQVKGRPGAAADVLRLLRKGWKIDPAVGFNKQQDIVHRVVGRPGIVLIGEGQHSRVRQLLASERTKHQRVAAGAPIHELVVGDGENEVPLEKLVRHVTKMKRGIQPAEMTELLSRLRALDASRQRAPVPKGPMPTSMKGQRGNLRGR